MERRKVSGWKTCATVGCGVLLVLGVLLGVVVVLNSTTIRVRARKAAETAELAEVRRAVVAHADVRSSDVRVYLTDPGQPSSTLRIEIGDVPLLNRPDTSDPADQAEAIAIAVVAHDALPMESRPARYEIVYTSSVAGGGAVKVSRTFEVGPREFELWRAAESAPR